MDNPYVDYMTFGGSKSKARGLDAELRTAAAQSPMANMMGAAMSMAQANILSPSLLSDPQKRNQLFAQIAGGTQADFMNMMAANGVNPAIASQFLNANNRGAISQFGIQSAVRGAQAADIDRMMQATTSGAFTAGLKETGLSLSERRTLGPQLAAAMQEQIRKDPSLLRDTDRLAGALNMMAPDVAPQQMEQVVKASLGAMQSQISNDPTLSKFGSVGNMLAMAGTPGPDDKPAAPIVKAEREQAAERQRRIDELRNKFGADTPEKREALQWAAKQHGMDPKMRDEINELGKLEQEAKQAEKDTKAGLGVGGTSNIKISGKLTLMSDGQGMIDAEGGVPVNE